MQNLQKWSPIVLRVGLGLVMLWFSSQQFMHANMWTGFLPSWTHSLPINSINFVHVNAWFELLAGVLLILGLFTRVVSLLLALHLLGITISLGYNAVAIRDFGLTIAFVSIFLYGSSDWSLDESFESLESVI